MTRNWLEEAMEYQGITVAEMARYLDVSSEYVADIIAGKEQEIFYPELLSWFADWLNIDMETAIRLEEEYCTCRDKLKQHTYIKSKLQDRFAYEICECLDTKKVKWKTLVMTDTLEEAYSRYKAMLYEGEIAYMDFDKDSERDKKAYISFAKYLAQLFLKNARDLIHMGEGVYLNKPYYFPEGHTLQVKMTRIK